MNKKTIMEVKDLSIHFIIRHGTVRAVDTVSFDLEKGETLGLVGESGCGKTTTVLGLLNMVPTPGRIVNGSISIDGVDITRLTENQLRQQIRWSKISMVFQGAMNCLTPVFTIKNQMMETLLQHKPMDKSSAMERIKKYIGEVGLSTDVLDRYPHELSGGMKQRIVIAIALFLEPDIVICDEPTTALDVIVQAQIINLLKELKQKLGISIIFITHDLATEAEIADRIAIMYAGSIVEMGTNEHIYGEDGPSHPYTKKLLAATPRLHGNTDTLEFIPGRPPDLESPPPGCRFHPRCSEVFEKCKQFKPPLIELAPGHMSACWRNSND